SGFFSDKVAVQEVGRTPNYMLRVESSIKAIFCSNHMLQAAIFATWRLMQSCGSASREANSMQIPYYQT
ncbi:MAG: hypothetical protein M1368_04390, partial [Thaumarchaeota archaeon]|nr:hypothetical protein [Nitrososphaerota archaeon]